MTIKDTEEAYLGPLDRQTLLALRLEDIQNYRHSVFVVVADDALIRVGCVAFDHATFLLRSLRRLVILQEECLRVQDRRILAEEQGLDLDELDVTVLIVLA